MQRLSCIRQGVTQRTNVQLERCPGGSGQWEIGRCRCAEDRLKFRSRIRELTEDLARLTSASGGNCSIYCANPVLNRTVLMLRREKARGFLEEIIRLECLLEVLDCCKNVFRPEATGTSIRTTADGRPWPVKTICGTDSTKKADDGGRHLPEYLLAPMRKNADDSYSLPGRKGKEHFTEQWRNTSGACPGHSRTIGSFVDNTTMRIMNDDEKYEQCGRPKMKCESEEDNCVLVYGFLPEAINRFILKFSLVGEVLEKKASQKKNWVLFRYRHSYDATQACQFDLCQIDGAVIGVTRWSSRRADPGEALIPVTRHQCDRDDAVTGVIRVRKHLRIRGKKVEEFTPRKLTFGKFISKRCFMWTLLFFIMWFIVFLS